MTELAGSVPVEPALPIKRRDKPADHLDLVNFTTAASKGNP